MIAKFIVIAWEPGRQSALLRVTRPAGSFFTSAERSATQTPGCHGFLRSFKGPQGVVIGSGDRALGGKACDYGPWRADSQPPRVIAPQNRTHLTQSPRRVSKHLVHHAGNAPHGRTRERVDRLTACGVTQHRKICQVNPLKVPKLVLGTSQVGNRAEDLGLASGPFNSGTPHAAKPHPNHHARRATLGLV